MYRSNGDDVLVPCAVDVRNARSRVGVALRVSLLPAVDARLALDLRDSDEGNAPTDGYAGDDPPLGELLITRSSYESRRESTV